MSNLNRRSFLKGSLGTLAGAVLLSNVRGEASALPKPTDVRTLGQTGLTCSYLGLGTGIRGRGRGITEQTMKLSGEQYVELLEHAYRQGITYFDMADQYGSHNYMREAMRRSIPRDQILLLSKVSSRDPEEARRDIERMRKELNTDCIDVLLMHCLHKGEETWPETLRATMDVFSEAKSKGWIRAHGVSCHNLTALAKTVEENWTDVVLARINPFGSHMDGPSETIASILQKIHSTGKGVLGMKILGEGDPRVLEKMDESLRYVGQLGCIDAMTIGFMSPKELDEVMARMDSMAS